MPTVNPSNPNKIETAQDAADEAKLAQLLAEQTFVFAKTMAHNPHYYTVRKTWASDEDFVWAVETMRRIGYKEKFGKTWYGMFAANGFKYWTMGCPLDITRLINRKPLDV